jgi:hypothetical protein
MKTICPFSADECSEKCSLFIKTSEINELFANRLHSIGVYDRESGMCSLKNIALGSSRFIFEKSSSNNF